MNNHIDTENKLKKMDIRIDLDNKQNSYTKMIMH